MIPQTIKSIKVMCNINVSLFEITDIKFNNFNEIGKYAISVYARSNIYVFNAFILSNTVER